MTEICFSGIFKGS